MKRTRSNKPRPNISHTTDSSAEVAAAVSRLRPNLRRWHQRFGRELPWRGCRDPYKVWISEIMLQQTTVTTVTPYFERFLQRFPNIVELAAAPEQDVLRLWEGLGYYSRARNLHRAAQAIRNAGGSFPESVDELLQLPGIGRYTAGAIVSFAFDRPAPIVEANTLRLYCRLLGLRGDPRSTAGQRLLWNFAEAIVPKKSPAAFNQAMMDLGATVCTPTEPRCDDCPLAPACRALAEQSQAEIPQPPPRATVTEVHEAYIAIKSRGRFLVSQRADGERWAGLWDFPRLPIADASNHKHDAPASSQPKNPGNLSLARRASDHPTLALSKLIADLESRLADQFGLKVTITKQLARLKHSVTRFRITLDCWQAECINSRVKSKARDIQWLAPSDFDSLPFSVTGRKLANLLLDETGTSS